jgi:hypothetical protein
MSVAELLDRARSAGITIEPVAGRLRLRSSRVPPADLLEQLRANKPAILEALAGDPLPPIDDRRRGPLELIDAVSGAGARLVVARARVYGAPGAKISAELAAAIETQQDALVAALTRVPGRADQPSLPDTKPSGRAVTTSDCRTSPCLRGFRPIEGG